MKKLLVLTFALAFAASAFATTVKDRMTFEGPVVYKNTVTTSGSGAQSIGDGSGTVAINSSDWDISATGAMTGIGAITADGLITGTAGTTVTGGVVNLNASSNNAVNIGTGTTTSTVTIGGAGAQTIAVGDGAAAKTVSLGSSNTTSTTTILSGSGGLNLNEDNNQPVDIGTGTSTGTVTIGGAAAQTISIGNGAAAKTVNLGSTNTTSTTNINAGSGGVIVTGTMAATSPKITTSILDADGDPMFGFTASAGTAVNYWRFDNAATGVIPAIYMIGDTNVSLSLNLKGSGAFRVQNQTATDDTIAIAPATGGGATYTGTITSADLTAAKTWTLPDATGTIATTAGVGSYKTVTAGSGTNNLTTADCGKVYTAAADADAVFNLPAVAAGCAYTFFNIGAAGNNLLTVNPDNADAIFGTVTLAASVVVINGAAGDAISNTKGTSQKGDTVTLVGTSAGWMIQASTGIWADIN